MIPAFRRTALTLLLLFLSKALWCWGFYGHQQINYHAVFLLPPDMIAFYKAHIDFLSEHATDPDKRRYAVAEEAPRHYIDIDHYGKYPYDSLPRKWTDAVKKFSEDSLKAYGIVPWHIQFMLGRLTEAFRKKDLPAILKNSAEIGHYISDAHVPLHASSNHNGQLTGQKGIHGFWESRIPELLAEKQFDYFIGHAAYISNPGDYIWKRVLESVRAADTVLRAERELSKTFPSDKKFAFENRNGITIRQYSSAYTIAYDQKLRGMTERRMRLAIYSTASFWYTAWINAGQPDLSSLVNKQLTEAELKESAALNEQWKAGSKMIGREE